jgi:ATP-dependent DNA ligase
MPPVAPMLAKVGADLPPGAFYEPKWDGFRAIVFRDGDEVEIGSRNTRPMARYFPRWSRRRWRACRPVRGRRRDRRARC